MPITLKFIIIITITAVMGNTNLQIPKKFKFNQSTQQAFYFIKKTSLINKPLEANDWIGAFKDTICIGARNWDVNKCNGICEIPIMGSDGSIYSKGYLNNNEFPHFIVYDFSEKKYFHAKVIQNFPFKNMGMYIIDSLFIEFDCNKVFGGNAKIDSCGVCEGDGSSCVDSKN